MEQKKFLLTSRNDYIVKDEFHPLSSFTLCVCCVQYNKIKFFFSLYHPLTHPPLLLPSSTIIRLIHLHFYERKFSCRGKNYFILFVRARERECERENTGRNCPAAISFENEKKILLAAAKKKPFLLSEAC